LGDVVPSALNVVGTGAQTLTHAMMLANLSKVNNPLAIISQIFKIKKDGIIQKCTAYACIGIDTDGKKEVLSLHIGGNESAKYWLSVMNDLKSRGFLYG